MDLAAALRTSGQDYEVLLDLSADSKEELIWWDTHMIKWNGKTMLLVEPDMVIESDASNLGWGAHCQGTGTGGPWASQEMNWHINCLELLAATLALPEDVREERDTLVSATQNRQHDGCCIYQQPRGDGVKEPGVPNTRTMDVVPGEEYSHPSAVPSRQTESAGRSGIQRDERPIR